MYVRAVLCAVPMEVRCSSTSISTVQVRVMSVEYVYACMIMARLKTGESRNTRHIANCEGTYVALHVQRRPLDWSAREMPKCCTMLRKMWPALPDSVLQEAPLGYKDGSVWALVEIGATYTKTCCQKKPCPHPCDARPGDAWCPERRDICVDTTYKFLHVTRLTDVIPLRFEVRVRPMQGLFTALIPAAAIPTDSMTGAQLHLWHHTREVVRRRK